MITKVCVIGLGYIGLPTASILANRGVDVIGVDINERNVNIINRGEVHFREPDLDIMVHGAVSAGKLRAVTKPECADVFVVAVPTPLKEGKKPDCSCIEAAAREIATFLSPGNLIALESTAPVGTTERFAQQLAGLRPDLAFAVSGKSYDHVHIAYCPERVLPGQILKELVCNDRVVGGIDRCCAEKAADFYRLFVQGECHLTDARTAEMTKLVENAYRDVNISFANELSLICDRLGVNVWDLIDLANRHPRVNVLKPGPGVGGHCIAVDPWFLVDSAPEEARLIRMAREVNDSKVGYVVSKVKKLTAGLASPTIACLGLAFKADVDDLRESPAVDVVKRLAREGIGRLLVVDPYVEDLPESFRGLADVRLTDVDEALKDADIIVGLVNHRQFAEIDRSYLASKRIFDACGMWL